MDYYKKKALKHGIFTGLFCCYVSHFLWIIVSVMLTSDTGTKSMALWLGIIAIGMHVFCIFTGYQEHYKRLLKLDTVAPLESRTYERVY